MSNNIPFPGPVSKEGVQALHGSCSESTRVRLVSGNVIRTVSVVNVPTAGPPLNFTLTYNSLDSNPSSDPMGINWRHNYMMNLLVPQAYNVGFPGTPGSPVLAFLGNGFPLKFRYTATGFVSADHFTQHKLEFRTDQTSGFSRALRLVDPDALMSYEFDPDGVLERVVDDASGQALTLVYGSGKLVEVVGPLGRKITLGYRSDSPYDGSLLTSITDPAGNTTLLTYDLTDKKMTSVSGPEGCAVTYTYDTGDQKHLITHRTDPSSEVFEYGYDGSDRLIWVKDAKDTPNQVIYTYDTPLEGFSPHANVQRRRTRITDPEGNVWDYRFDPAGDIHRVQTPLDHWTRRYYHNGILLYDMQGFPKRHPNSTVPHYGDNQNNRFTRFAINDRGKPTHIFDPAGRVTHLTYDESGDRVTSVYETQGHLGVQGLWHSNFGGDGYLLCAFNPDGSDVSVLPSYVDSISSGTPAPTAVHADSPAYHHMDPRALTGNFGSDTAHGGLQRQVGDWRSASDGAEFVFDIELNAEASFNLSLYTAAADLGSVIPKFALHPFSGRDLEIEVADLDFPDGQTYRIYNNNSGYWVTFPVRGDDENPITVTVRPVGENILVATISAITFDPLASRRTDYAYDSRGRLTSVTNPVGDSYTLTYNSLGLLASVSDLKDRVTNFYYEDDQANLTRIEAADDTETLFSYDENGNTVSVTDANGHITQMEYDGKNRLTRVTDPVGSTTTMEYDSHGNLLSIVDALERETTFEYDENDRLVKILDPVNGAGDPTVLSYDDAGRLATVTDPRANTVEYVRDDEGRVVEVDWPDGEKTSYGLDVWNRVVAINTPNANQSVSSSVNLVGAINLIRNPTGEISAPNRDDYPQGWNRTGGSWDKDNERKMRGYDNRENWYQSNIYLPPGVVALAEAYATNISESAVSGEFQINTVIRDVDGAPNTVSSAAKSLPHGLGSQKAEIFPMTIPADAQFGRFPLVSYGIKFNDTATPTRTQIDNTALHPLGTAYHYNTNDELIGVLTPDGAEVRLERDRLGRVRAWLDPRGQRTLLEYDTLDRLIGVVDPEGNEVSYAYDEVGNLVSFTDARDHTTSYTYDDLDRLLTITYPDTTTEEFTYDAVGNLASYTDNLDRTRTFSYDPADRLIRVTYSDASTVEFSYDAVGNVLSRKERNDDQVHFEYDDLDRLTRVWRQPDPANSTPEWVHQYAYDENGNRTQLKVIDPTASRPEYGSAQYNIDSYPEQEVFWEVPAAGYDDMDRLVEFKDGDGNSTLFAYDAEGRRTTITYPKPDVDPVTTQASYDIMGRLLELDTTQGTNELLNIKYTYDEASNRTSMVSGDDTQDYGIDKAGRLVEMALNRFVERRDAHFAHGELDGTDYSDSGEVSLLALGDTFAGYEINANRWNLAYATDGATKPILDFVGMEIRQLDGLHMAHPRGFCNTVIGGFDDTHLVRDHLQLLLAKEIWGAAQIRHILSGDFDIEVDYRNFQCEYYTGWVALEVRSQSTHRYPLGSWAQIMREVDAVGGSRYRARSHNFYEASAATTDLSGSLRLVRSGSTLSFYAGVTLIGSTTWTSEDVYISLKMNTINSIVSVEWRNFSIDGVDYPTTGSYTSATYDAGRSVEWGQLSWAETLPAGCDVKFQVAVSDDPEGPWVYLGPDGTTGTFFTTPAGEDIVDDQDDPLEGRYCRYQATLTGTGTATPEFSNVHLSYAGDNDSALHTYAYDPAGNMTEKKVVTDTTTVTETRTYNNMNELTANTVVDGGGTTNWTFTSDANGNMTTKSDGTDTWTYVWDEDNQLIEVKLNTNTLVEYQYDVDSRVLVRDDGSSNTKFEWDGWDLIREEKSGGVVETTDYASSNGEHLAFKRGGELYAIHGDGLSSIQLVTNETGNQVSRAAFGAWGETLSLNESVPGDIDAQFIGGLGVRTDMATGLIYMRHRWYDPTTGRFLSRDPLGLTTGLNLYEYASNNPTLFKDPHGLGPDYEPTAEIYVDVPKQIGSRTYLSVLIYSRLPGLVRWQSALFRLDHKRMCWEEVSRIVPTTNVVFPAQLIDSPGSVKDVRIGVEEWIAHRVGGWPYTKDAPKFSLGDTIMVGAQHLGGTVFYDYEDRKEKVPVKVEKGKSRFAIFTLLKTQGGQRYWKHYKRNDGKKLLPNCNELACNDSQVPV